MRTTERVPLQRLGSGEYRTPEGLLIWRRRDHGPHHGLWVIQDELTQEAWNGEHYLTLRDARADAYRDEDEIAMYAVAGLAASFGVDVAAWWARYNPWAVA